MSRASVSPGFASTSLRGLRFVFAGWLLAGIGGPFSADAVEAADPVPYEIKPAEQGPKVFRDGQLLTQYLELSGHKPVLYPLIGPGGAAMTRSYPIAATRPGEREDHVHHRSLWFTHGEVNGVDFWAEGDGRGKIIQTDLRTEKTGDGVAIRTENAWQAPTGEKLLSDVRELVFHDVEGTRAIDFDIVLTAGDAPVVFGDTKEGSFGIRVAGTMKVDSEPGGSIVNSEGDQGAAAWGKRASWVDYTGPVDGQIVGVAILNHPASFNYPTRWHVRTYGLFAANPFGVHHFEGGEPTPGVKLEPGESLTLRYRVLMHEGHTSQADIAEHWERYAGL